VLLRVNELALSEANDTATADTRLATSYEVRNLLAELIAVGNTNLDGNYIFSGFKTNIQPFDSSGTYQGDTGSLEIYVDRAIKKEINVTGDSAFSDPSKLLSSVVGDSVGRGTLRMTAGSNNPVTLPIDATSVTVDSTNNKLVFTDTVANYTITLANGTYTSSTLAAEIKTKMEAAITTNDTYTVSFDPSAGTFSIKNDTGNTNTLQLLWSDAAATAEALLGYDAVDSAVLAAGASDTGDFIAGLRIDSTNNGIVFDYGGTEYTATIASGTYTTAGLNAAVKAAMEAAEPSGDTFTVSYAAGRFTIPNDAGNGSNLTLKWSDTGSTAASVLGFAAADSAALAAGSSVTSDNFGGMLVDASPELIRDTINAPMTGAYAAADTIGTGTLTFKVGAAETVTLTVDSTNNTPTLLRDAINALGTGIEVRIATDTVTSEQRLLFRPAVPDTVYSIDVSNDSDGNDKDTAGLSALVHTEMLSNLTTTALGVEAVVINDTQGKRLLLDIKDDNATLTIDVDETNDGDYVDAQDTDATGLSRLYHASSTTTNMSTSISFFTVLDHLKNSLTNNDDTGIRASSLLLDSALDRVLNVRADIGARLKYIEDHKLGLEDDYIFFSETLSDFEDADIAEAATEMAKIQASLEAMRLASLRILSQTLLDFLK
jgi:flagellin-like hook-associated protein FlgL